MARIDNLTNFLEDVANAIKAKRELASEDKIAASKFDTEIMKIQTGESTSDADATPNDLLNPKTAYVNGTKIIGSIATEYGDTKLSTIDKTYSVSNISIRNHNLFQSISLEYGYAVRLDANTINVYSITDDVWSIYKSISTSGTLMNFDTGTIYIMSISGNLLTLCLCVCKRASTRKYTAYTITLNLDTEEITIISTLSNFVSISLATEHGTEGIQWEEQLRMINDKFVFIWSKSPGVGYENATWSAHTSILNCNSNILSLNYNQSYTIGTIYGGDDWNQNRPQIISCYTTGNYIVIKVITGKQGTVPYYYATVAIDIVNKIAYKKFHENSNIGYVFYNDKFYGNNHVYDLSGNSIADIDFSTQCTECTIVYSNYIITATTIYEITNTSLKTISATGCDGQGIDFIHNIPFIFTQTALMTYKSEQIVTSMTRNSIKYYDTSDADITANDIVQDKIAYGPNGKVRGNIIDNRNLIVSPFKNSMYIYEGDPNFHISGKMPQDPSVVDYTTEVRTDIPFVDLAQAIGLTADKIKAGETILGITGTYEGSEGPITQEYDQALQTANEIKGGAE